MQYAGRPSWSVRIGGPTTTLERALFVRDAADLPVPEGPALPPRLVAPDARVPRMLGPDARDEAARQWLSWWRDCLDLVVLRTLQDGPLVGGAWREDLNRAPAVVGEAPRWEALADRPALHRAVLLSQTPWESWRHAVQGPGARGGAEELRRGVEHRHLAALAERITTEYGVSPDRVRARVLFISAPGLWWQRLWPGIAVATEDATNDTATLLALLEDAFVSGL